MFVAGGGEAAPRRRLEPGPPGNEMDGRRHPAGAAVEGLGGPLSGRRRAGGGGGAPGPPGAGGGRGAKPGHPAADCHLLGGAGPPVLGPRQLVVRV